jgi:hypothetical protein
MQAPRWSEPSRTFRQVSRLCLCFPDSITVILFSTGRHNCRGRPHAVTQVRRQHGDTNRTTVLWPTTSFQVKRLKATIACEAGHGFRKYKTRVSVNGLENVL